MQTGNLYAITGIVCVLICLAIYNCNITIYDKDIKIRWYFSFLLINFVICDLIDVAWGFMSTGTLDLGRGGFVAASFAIHFYAVFIAACWCIFLTGYFGFKEDRLIMILQCIPLALAVFLLASQFIYGDTLFIIDEELNYSAGPLRAQLFYIQCCYLVITFLKVLFFVLRHWKEHSGRYKSIVLCCSVIPFPFIVLQCLYPDGPYTTIGYMACAIFVFNGMMVIEKNRTSRKYEVISKESYMTLDALAQGFVSIILIDLDTMKEVVVKSTPYADALIDDSMQVRDKLIKIFTSSCKPEFTDKLRDFADIDLLPERMVNRRSVSMEYCSEGIGWCDATFIAAQRDEERNLKKVVLAVSSIDERKKKEQEYENALSRAYQNENAVFAELIKMESTGVVASQDRKVIIVNDAALELFGKKGVDTIGMDVLDLWDDAPIKISEEVKKRSLEVEEKGGEFSYQTVVYVEGDEKDVKYIMADVRRIDLLDGSRVMITCFTDMTAGKLLEDKLRTLSETDALTNIANRRCGESQIRLLLNEGVGGIFCLFDVNDFKRINDTFGHQTGDDTLVAVADAIRASFRADDIFMRLGGDEFAIYMRNVATADLAKIRIARLLENIARIELPNIPKGSVTISLGAVIVESAEGAINVKYEDVYRQADAKMYKCKGKPGSNVLI
ncbi:MAG: diguanylate cyclase [Lachnospiraceae bacterium]|nr:diguanylate cyclase [Lachnospiraceae bacterium]